MKGDLSKRNVKFVHCFVENVSVKFEPLSEGAFEASISEHIKTFAPGFVRSVNKSQFNQVSIGFIKSSQLPLENLRSGV